MLRSACEVAPDDADLLSALQAQLTSDDPVDERASVLERLLTKRVGVEAASLALALAALREQQDDAAGVERALEAAFAATPGDAVVRGPLEERYAARGAHAELASVRERYARQIEVPEERAAVLVEAARMHRDVLGDSSRAAVLLGEARELLPADRGLLGEYARALAAAGRHADAIAAVSGELGAVDAAEATGLLRLRAELRGASGGSRKVCSCLP